MSAVRRRALVVEHGGARGAVAAVRALAAAGWTVGVGAPGARSYAAASRFASWRHDIPRPLRRPDAFVSAVAGAIAERGYDVVFGCGDADVLALSAHGDEIDAASPYPPHDAVLSAFDKLSLANAAAASGLASPRTAAYSERALDELVPPVVVKSRLHLAPPRDGGSMRVEACVAFDRDAARRRASAIAAAGAEPIVQEQAHGRLMAVVVLADRASRVLSAVGQLSQHTWPARAGVSARAHTVPIPDDLREGVERLIARLGWFGLAQLQFVVGREGDSRLIDFNGRFYGSLALAVKAGPNLPAAWASLAVGEPVPTLPPPRPATRYQWLEGDLRRALVERSGGMLHDLARTLAAFPGATHSVFRLDDPGPALHYVANRLARAVRHLTGTVGGRIASSRPRGARAGSHPAGVRRAVREPAESPPLSVDVLDSAARLSGMEEKWRALAEARGSAFVSPEWLHAWMSHYGHGSSLAVAAVRGSEGELRGVIPLVASRSFGSTVLRFAGANLGDRFHPAAMADDERDVAAAAAEPLRAGGWGAIVLDNVDAGASWVEAMRDATGIPTARYAYRRNVLPAIALRASWEEYLATRSRNMRSQLSRRTRRLARDHGLRFRLARDPASIRDEVDAFFALHDARWQGRGGSASSTVRSRAFHADFAAAALDRGWLRLWFLELEGRPAAAWYGWRLGATYAYYLAGFDPRWSRHSVGLVLLAHTIRAAIEEGAAEYDLLLGEEHYKSRFANLARQVETVLVCPERHPMRLLAGAEVRLTHARRRLPEPLAERIESGARAAASRLPAARRR